MGKVNEKHPCFAAFWQVMQKSFPGVRRQLVPLAAGTVLEIGAGMGENLSYYHWKKIQRLTLLEPEPTMRAQLEARALVLNQPVEVVAGEAEGLPFCDSTFDMVLCTFVFCSVTDLTAAIAETHRVLKPGGQLLFAEHVRYKNALLGGLQDLLTPVQIRLFAGCHLNRQSLKAFQQGGFNITACQQPYPGLPIYIGVARQMEAPRV